jgi:YegS/Rv2252/BmrU family lipid kinase
MQKGEPLKILFVINPVSGGKKKGEWEEVIRTYFKNSPHQMEFFLLSGKGDDVSIAHHIQSVKPDRVVSVGGDGTVKMVAELLFEKDITLGILPAGSANGMAKELSIPAEVNAALEIAVNGHPTAIDVIRVNGDEICIHLSDIGLNAMLVKYFESSEKRGMWGYGKAIFRVLYEKQKMYVTITTPEGTIKRKAYMVVLANARKYGTGGNINPDGDVSDGFFEVVIMRKINLPEILKGILTNRSFHPDKIEVLKTTRVEMSTLKKAYFQVDGEYRGRVSKVEAEILPGAITVMLPAEKDRK